jgi:CrcB protein
MKTHTLSTRRRWLAVLGGGFLGAITRYLLSAAMQASLGKAWPYDIFVINLTGAFVLALVTVLADATTLVGPTRRLFINVGFLGAYTTFSSLALGDVLLLGQAHWLAASIYLVLSIPGGLLLALLGETAGRWFVTLGRRFSARAQARQQRRSAHMPSHRQDIPARAGSGDGAEQALLLNDPEGQEVKHSRSR